MKYGILSRSMNKVVSWYTGTRIAYKAPFADQIAYLHFEVTETYPEAYSLDEIGNLQYDFTYTPQMPSYEKAKEAELTLIQVEFAELTKRYAVENSTTLSNEITRKAIVFATDNTDPDGLDVSNPVNIATFIRSKLDPLVDAIKPLVEDIESHYFWRVEEHIAAIPREPLLASDERLAQYQIDLLAIVRP